KKKPMAVAVVAAAPQGGGGILIILVWAWIIGGGGGVLADTDPGDLAAMRELAAALGADRALAWGGSSNPDPCTPAGSWPGVSCSPDGRVVAIQAGNRSLSGSLPPAVRNLSSLTRLELHSNLLSGPLPSLSPPLSPPSKSSSSTPTASPPSPRLLLRPLLPLRRLPRRQPLLRLAAPRLPPRRRRPRQLLRQLRQPLRPPPLLPRLRIPLPLPPLPRLQLPLRPRPLLLRLRPVPLPLAQQPARPSRLSGPVSFLANLSSLQQLCSTPTTSRPPPDDLSALADLRDLQLRDNRLTGIVPSALTALPSLAKLTLTNNLLQGPVPVFPPTVADLDLVVSSESFCRDAPGDCDPRVDLLLSVARSFGYPVRFAQNWKGNDPCAGNWIGVSCDAAGNVTVISFQRMGLSGTISPDFAKFPSLQRLLLSNNNISGTIPAELANSPALKELDVANNSLWGPVPAFRKNVLVNTAGNPNIGEDGPAPGAGNSSSGAGSNDGGGGNGSNTSGSPGSGDGVDSRRPSSSSVGVIVGSVVAAVAALSLAGVLGFCYYKRKEQRFSRVQSPNTTVIHPRHSGSDPDVVKITVAAPNGGAGQASDTHSRTSSSGPSDVHVVEAGNMVISIQVLRNVTNNFSEENILGRGGFGTVYKGELHDGTKIAVKRMEAAGAMGTKGLNEFKSEIAVLTKVRHRNLVSLLGYLHIRIDLTGRVTTKADVFSFGVILMELITGRKALDETQPEESVHLVTWFRRMQLNKDTFRKAIDPTIDVSDGETLASVSTVAELAGHCCAREPHQRPDMGHAVNVLSTLAELWKPSDPDSDQDSYGIDLDMTLPQALKKWQAFENGGTSSYIDGATSSSSFLASLDNTQTSIPTRPPGFADSFTSADGR
ncbi:Receptor protein kinase TMK1, partial [Ananas comosus]